MSKDRKPDKIVGITGSGKIIIRWDDMRKVLTKEERIFMHGILGKLIEYDKKNGVRE